MPSIGPDDLQRPVRQFVSPVQSTVLTRLTVAEALESLRRRAIEHRVTYFFAVDDQNRLQGVVPTRTLLLAEPGQTIDKIMHSPVVSVRADESLEEAMELFAIHRYLALPVVDDDGVLLGAISVQLYADEAWDMAEAERLNDAFQLIGIWVDRMRQASPLKAYRMRMPWLVCNVVGGLLCALITTMFGLVVEKVLVIAAFIPLVLSLCESISIQSLTLSLQQLHGKLRWPQFRKLVAMEWRTALLLATTSGLAVGLASLFWSLHWRTLSVMSLSLLAAMWLAATLGLVVPALLRLVKLDPKVAAGPVVLMCVDTCTMLLYLGLATAMLLG